MKWQEVRELFPDNFASEGIMKLFIGYRFSASKSNSNSGGN